MRRSLAILMLMPSVLLAQPKPLDRAWLDFYRERSLQINDWLYVQSHRDAINAQCLAVARENPAESGKIETLIAADGRLNVMTNQRLAPVAECLRNAYSSTLRLPSVRGVAAEKPFSFTLAYSADSILNPKPVTAQSKAKSKLGAEKLIAQMEYIALTAPILKAALDKAKSDCMDQKQEGGSTGGDYTLTVGSVGQVVHLKQPAPASAFVTCVGRALAQAKSPPPPAILLNAAGHYDVNISIRDQGKDRDTQ